MSRKTCEDCIYWANRLCHLYPQAIVAERGHWCGQLREKPQTYVADHSLDSLDLPLRAKNILLSQGIDIHKLRKMSRVDLLKLPQCGLRTMTSIMDALYRDDPERVQS